MASDLAPQGPPPRAEAEPAGPAGGGRGGPGGPGTGDGAAREGLPRPRGAPTGMEWRAAATNAGLSSAPARRQTWRRAPPHPQPPALFTFHRFSPLRVKNGDPVSDPLVLVWSLPPLHPPLRSGQSTQVSERLVHLGGGRVRVPRGGVPGGPCDTPACLSCDHSHQSSGQRAGQVQGGPGLPRGHPYL